ncbi:MAG: hypothetical protein HQL87_13065 [Magnetococcales bacterium]|nr:hypothetical protein [Magnetococcales bacterium]
MPWLNLRSIDGERCQCLAARQIVTDACDHANPTRTRYVDAPHQLAEAQTGTVQDNETDATAWVGTGIQFVATTGYGANDGANQGVYNIIPLVVACAPIYCARA